MLLFNYCLEKDTELGSLNKRKKSIRRSNRKTRKQDLLNQLEMPEKESYLMNHLPEKMGPYRDMLE